MRKVLSSEEWLKAFEWVPRVAVDILVEDGQGRILLAQRGIPPKVGAWHIPGGFLDKGETIKECLSRISKKEIGLSQEFEWKLGGVFENLDKDPRGHVIDLIYKVKIPDPSQIIKTSENEAVRFFEKIDVDVAFGHDEFLKNLGYFRLF